MGSFKEGERSGLLPASHGERNLQADGVGGTVGMSRLFSTGRNGPGRVSRLRTGNFRDLCSPYLSGAGPGGDEGRLMVSGVGKLHKGGSWGMDCGLVVC